MIGKLYVSHADGTVSRDLVPAGDLKSYWRGASDPVETVVNRAADDCGLFEIQQLFIGGESDVYVSLAQDSLARLGQSIDSERGLRAYGKTKIIDTLWIMVPLAFLCAALSFCLTRNYFSSADGFTKEEVKEIVTEKVAEKAAEVRREQIENTQRPLFIGQLAQADQAIQAENALYARQILVGQPALTSYTDNRQFKLPEMRGGFEWRYLWRNLHSERHLLLGQRGGVNAVAVSADGKWAATAGAASDAKLDGTIRIWDLATGKLLALVPGKREQVHAVAFAPDGKTLASAGADKLVRFWNLSGLKGDFVEIDKEAKTLSGHSDTVLALAYGKDGQLASAGADKIVILWDIAAGTQKHVLKEHAGADPRAHLFRRRQDARQRRLGREHRALGRRRRQETPGDQDRLSIDCRLALAPDGTLASGGLEAKAGIERGVIRFWTTDGKEIHKPIEHGAAVRAVAFQPDASKLVIASGGSDHVIRAFDAKTGAQVRRWIGHLGAVNALAFANTGDTLLSGSIDSTAKAWNPHQSSGPEIIHAHDDWVQCLALNPKNTLLASGARDGTLKLWDPATTRLLKELPKEAGVITALALSHHAEKTFLAVGTRGDKDEGNIKIFEIEIDAQKNVTAKETRTLKDHTKGITCLAFCPLADRADMLVSGSADQTVKVWNIATGKAKSHAGHKSEVRCVAFGPDGKSFASGGKDSLVCLYDLDRDNIWTITDLHINSVEAICFLPINVPDEHEREVPVHILTGSADLSIKRTGCLKVENGKTEFQTNLTLRSHAQPISGLLFNDQGANSLTASAGWDGAIKLYDMKGERLTLLGHQGAVRAIATPGDQSFLVSAGNDGTLRFWLRLSGSARGEGSPEMTQKTYGRARPLPSRDVPGFPGRHGSAGASPSRADRRSIGRHHRRARPRHRHVRKVDLLHQRGRVRRPFARCLDRDDLRIAVTRLLAWLKVRHLHLNFLDFGIISLPRQEKRVPHTELVRPFEHFQRFLVEGPVNQFAGLPAGGHVVQLGVDHAVGLHHTALGTARGKIDLPNQARHGPLPIHLVRHHIDPVVAVRQHLVDGRRRRRHRILGLKGTQERTAGRGGQENGDPCGTKHDGISLPWDIIRRSRISDLGHGRNTEAFRRFPVFGSYPCFICVHPWLNSTIFISCRNN